jgi:hypothetical protein
MPQPLNSSRDVSRATVAAGLGRQDAAPEQMADVRTQRVDLLLLAVERERIVAALAVPERLVERLAQPLRAPLEPVGERWVVPALARESRRAPKRVVGVALDLAGRDRRLGTRPVGEQDRVPRVLPALVVEPAGRAPAVLEEAVAVEVALLLDPAHCGASVLFESADEFAVPCPQVVLVEQNEEERGRIVRAVVGRVRSVAEHCQFAAPPLVQDLSGLGVAKVVALDRLQFRERLERRLRKPRLERKQLVGADDAVAAEERHVPGQAASGE